MPEYLDTLAEAYYVNGNYDKAIEIEKQVVGLSPGVPSFKESLDKYQRAKDAKNR